MIGQQIIINCRFEKLAVQ